MCTCVLRSVVRRHFEDCPAALSMDAVAERGLSRWRGKSRLDSINRSGSRRLAFRMFIGGIVNLALIASELSKLKYRKGDGNVLGCRLIFFI